MRDTGGDAITILLVEDNPDDADLVRIAMDDAGVQAVLDVATGGRAAMQYLQGPAAPGRNRYPDLILLDLNLPDVDGRQVLQAIKADPDLAVIPLVVMSTSVDDNDVLGCYRARANGFVSKAPDYSELVETVQAIDAFWLRVARLPPQRR